MKTSVLTGNSIAAIAAALLASAALIIGVMTATANAASVIKVTSNIAQVPAGESLKMTIGTADFDDVYSLEVDHSFEGTLPEFHVYANQANPYGDPSDKADFDAAGVTVAYANGEWTIDFGDTVTDVIRNNGGEITFYFALRDSAGNYLWGDMFNVLPEYTFTYDVIAGTGDELIPSAVSEPSAPNYVDSVRRTGLIPSAVSEPSAPVVPGVPNTGRTF